MPIVKVNEILSHAAEHKYGVAAVNTFNIESVKYIIEAAEAERVPVIVQFYPGFSRYTALNHLTYAACDMAAKASVPVGVHLDHSATFEIAVGGIRDGFPSVMVDGSSLPYEDNVALTQAVVRTAGVFGVDVEAELGHVGSGAVEDDITNSNHYTNVEQAADFVERTGCGALAIAVGNAHGAYIRTPKLDFDRIKAIRERISVPLVLHGCSDIPDEQLQRAVNLGMSKFNIATEYFRAMYRGLERDILSKEFDGNGVALMTHVKEDMVGFVRGKIQLLNPNRYSL